MTFKNLGLINELLKAIDKKGYTTPTPIQEQTIPLALKAKDLLAGAQTGTGKTACFVLPILQKIANNPSPIGKQKNIKALILTPTRELAAQIFESTQSYSSFLSIKSTVIYGGVSIIPQISKLENGVDIVIATPGRLLDHINQKTIDLSKIDVFVLDEADRMLDMGFIRDIKEIIKLLPNQKQTLLFSATFSKAIKVLANGLLKNPVEITIAKDDKKAPLITQILYRVDRERKTELLCKIIQEENWYQALIFTRMKHTANKLFEKLEKAGIPSGAIHGNKSQAQRSKVLERFKSGKLQVLVATDVVARGIDIHDLPYVVNFELPNLAEDYIHRIGRTGRAGKNGKAISLVCVDELGLLDDIEKLLKIKLEEQTYPGFEVDKSIKAKPIQNGMNRKNTPGNQNNKTRKSSESGTNNNNFPKNKSKTNSFKNRRVNSTKNNTQNHRQSKNRSSTNKNTAS